MNTIKNIINKVVSTYKFIVSLAWLQPLLHRLLIITFGLTVITLAWSFSIHGIANYMYNALTAPVLR